MKNVQLNFPEVSQEAWKQMVQAELKGADFNQTLVWKTLEEINVKPYYSKEDAEGEQSFLTSKTPPLIVAKYNPLFFSDVEGFWVDKPSNQEEFYGKSFFLTDESLKTNDKSDNYLLFDAFKPTEGKNDLFINLGKIKEFSESAQYKKSILVDVSLHQNSGANISEQLACAMAKINEYVEIFGTEILDKIFVKFAVGYNYFFEIAKLRAFRLLWDQMMKTYNSQAKPYIFTESSLRNKANLDVENNLIRSTLEAASAIIGGTDALFIHNYSDWNSENTFAEELSYKQSLVLTQESVLDAFKDASRGSYYVENLTRFLAKNAWTHFQEIEKEGGYLKSWENLSIQKRIIAQAKKEQEAFDKGELVLIGVNKFPKDKNILDKEKKELYYDSKILIPHRLAESIE